MMYTLSNSFKENLNVCIYIAHSVKTLLFVIFWGFNVLTGVGLEEPIMIYLHCSSDLINKDFSLKNYQIAFLVSNSKTSFKIKKWNFMYLTYINSRLFGKFICGYWFSRQAKENTPAIVKYSWKNFPWVILMNL